MSDFAQFGPITTLTRLGSRPLVELEDALVRHTRRNKAALLIPSLVSELERPALARICEEIAKVPYLDTVLISLDRADEAGYKGALEYFRRLKRRTVVLWNDGPGVKALLEKLDKSDLVLGERGKGRACWMGFGYLLAQGNVAICRDLVAQLAQWFPQHADQLDSALAHWMFSKSMGGKPVVLRRGLSLR